MCSWRLMEELHLPCLSSLPPCSWWVMDLGPQHQLICNHYTLRHDASTDFLRSWVLQVGQQGFVSPVSIAACCGVVFNAVHSFVALAGPTHCQSPLPDTAKACALHLHPPAGLQRWRQLGRPAPPHQRRYHPHAGAVRVLGGDQPCGRGTVPLLPPAAGGPKPGGSQPLPHVPVLLGAL